MTNTKISSTELYLFQIGAMVTPYIKTEDDEFMFIGLHTELSELVLVTSLDPELRTTVLGCLRLTKDLLTAPRHVLWTDIFRTMIATLLRFRDSMSQRPIVELNARLPTYLNLGIGGLIPPT